MDTTNITSEEDKSLQIFLDLTRDFKGLGYFFMPLAGIPVSDIKRSIASCHINKSLDNVYVQVSTIPKLFDTSIATLDTYLFTIRIKKKTFIVFKILDNQSGHVKSIVSGKCTTLPLKTKALICRYSGLDFLVGTKGKINTHFLLQALYENNDVRTVLATCLGTRVDEIPVELIGALPEDSEVYIENWIKTNKNK